MTYSIIFKNVVHLALHRNEQQLVTLGVGASVSCELGKPTNLGTLGPQRAEFSSKVQTSLYRVPSRPRMPRVCPWRRRRPGRRQSPTRKTCSCAPRTRSCSYPHGFLVFVVLLHTESSGPPAGSTERSAPCTLYGNALFYLLRGFPTTSRGVLPGIRHLKSCTVFKKCEL